MSLEEYWRKRNFKKTSEPQGRVHGEPGNIYIIQRHQASHLHYDLRLEREGVLKVGRFQRSLQHEGCERLAIHTEDHPIEYANFEGVIPEGEYGAETVETWDKGTYNTEKWRETEIIIHINGDKLEGRCCLIKIRKQENAWLFFKC